MSLSTESIQANLTVGTGNKLREKLSPDDKDKYIIEHSGNDIICNLSTKRAEYTCLYKLKRISNEPITWYSRFDSNTDLKLIGVTHKKNGIKGGPEYSIEEDDNGSKSIRIEIPKDMKHYEFTIKYSKKFSLSEVSSIGKNKRVLIHFFFSFASMCNYLSANIKFISSNINIINLLTPANIESDKNEIIINQNFLSANQFIPITALVEVGFFKYISVGDKLLWAVISGGVGIALGFFI